MKLLPGRRSRIYGRFISANTSNKGTFPSNCLCYRAMAIVCSGYFEDDHEGFTPWSSNASSW
jgi:hypothetical protein